MITLAGSRLRMKNLGHNFGQVRLLVYFLFCGCTSQDGVIDDESLVKPRTNTCLSETSGIPSYSLTEVCNNIKDKFFVCLLMPIKYIIVLFVCLLCSNKFTWYFHKQNYYNIIKDAVKSVM
jgi:hypothetical protein